MPAADLLNQVLPHLYHSAPNAAVLAVFVSTIAYVHSPRAKAMIFSFPIPFTCAYLATRHPIDVTNIAGLFLGTIYHWLVFYVVRRRGWPIGAGIATGLVFFITGAAFFNWLAAGLGWGPLAFLPGAGLAVVAWYLGYRVFRPSVEPGHRSTAPWWVKAPLIFAAALVIYSLTWLIGGAVMLFPYAGVFTSYEMRHSLRTLAGFYMVNNIAIIMLLLATWSLENSRFNIMPWPLLAGWAALLASYLAMYWFKMERTPEAVPTGD